MLSQLPINLKNVLKENLDKEILRAGMIAELDAVSFYEQMAAMTDDRHIKAVLLDIAREEKTHIAEFEALLLKIDKEQVEESEKGKKEVEELISWISPGNRLKYNNMSEIIIGIVVFIVSVWIILREPISQMKN